jgi:hypothetical protein
MPLPNTLAFPKLRAVDVRPAKDQPGAYQLADPSGIAPVAFTVSGATLAILSRMDGKHDRPDIQVDFLRRFGRMLFSDELDGLIRQLDQALLLDGPAFEAHLRGLEAEYRRATTRPIHNADALGAPTEKLGEYIDSFLNNGPGPGGSATGGHETPTRIGAGQVVGLIAPHLDYARGAPCYAAAYRGLTQRTDASRFVILGTNHFGRSCCVVGTSKDFDTPFGVVPHDGAFMEAMNRRLDTNLCANEYDHLREHSVELQALLLKHLFADRPITIAPYLCPDPCGPTGTAPREGDGVDLKDFAQALGALVESDDTPTCLIAGADLSHVGRFFNDDRDLDVENLRSVEWSDREALLHLEAGAPENFRAAVADRNNDTNICSVGCIYALATALNGRASAKLLHYHQALVAEHENCVSCAAVEFTR